MRFNNKKTLVVFMAILIIQCSLLVYWQGHRGGYYIDELYSFGYAKNFAKDSASYITDTDLWKYNVWLDANTLSSELKVTDKDSLFSLPVSKTIHLLASKRSYMGLLNMAVYGANSFKDYCQRALALNILFFIISEFLLAYCIKILTDSNSIAILSVIMFGFSAIIMGMCEYVRFYMLAIMLLLVVVLCHLKMLAANHLYIFIIWEMVAFIAAYYGLMHSEFFLVICGSFFSLFLFLLLCKKKFLQFLFYMVPLVCGCYRYVYSKTDLIQAALNITKYAQTGSTGKHRVAINIVTHTRESSIHNLGLIIDCVVDKWFGNGCIIIAFLILFLICFVFLIKQRGKRNQKIEKGSYLGFIIIVAITAIIEIAFNIIASLYANRYQVYSILLLMMAFWYLVGFVYRKLQDERVIAAFFAVTAVSAILCQQTGRLPFLFVEEKTITQTVEQYKETDHVIFQVSNVRHAVYDCISHCQSGTKIYAPSPSQEISISQINPPDQFIAWCPNVPSVCKMIRSLDGSDYTFKALGSTHENRVFLCSKNK